MADSETVTIGKAYFQAILRRADLHAPIEEPKTAFGLVSLSKTEYNRLVQAENDYMKLKAALFRGGFTAENLSVLLEYEEHGLHNTAVQHNSGANGAYNVAYNIANVPALYVSSMPPKTAAAADQDMGGSLRKNSGSTTTPSFSSPDDRDGHFMHDNQKPRGSPNTLYPKTGFRTLLLTGLSDRTTLKDLTDVIRGGMLMDVYIRGDRSAIVSFADPNAAAAWYAYVRRNDLYLHMKRVEVHWNDRQFTIPGHVINKLGQGVSRNFIIRNGSHTFEDEYIREHLEHIHNLVVIDITYKDFDVHISTNSVHNALFARTCMMSRAMYKGFKVDWDSDECAAPLPQDNHGPHYAKSTPRAVQKLNPRQNSKTMANMFSALALDETEDGSNASEPSADDTLTSHAYFSGADLNWASPKSVMA